MGSEMCIRDRNEYVLAGSDRNFQELGPLGPNFTQLYQDQSGSWSDYVSFPMALRKRKPDVVHIPHHDCPPMMPGRLVLTIHDCVHIKFPPDHLSRIRRYELYRRTKRAVEVASQILAVSNSTRDDLVNIFDLDARRIAVIHNALDERFAAASGLEDKKTVLEGISSTIRSSFTQAGSAHTRTFTGSLRPSQSSKTNCATTSDTAT